MLTRWRDADGVGAAGADGAAGDGVQSLIEADFDGGEVVVSATHGETLARNGWIGSVEERDDLRRRHGGLGGDAG